MKIKVGKYPSTLFLFCIVRTLLLFPNSYYVTEVLYFHLLKNNNNPLFK